MEESAITSTERKAELLAVLEETGRETRLLFEALNEGDFDRKTDESNWTVGQLAGHIAQAPWANYVVKKLAAGKNASPPAPLGFALHLGNWWNVRRFKRTSKVELLQTWSEAIQKYTELVRSLPDDVLDNGGAVVGRGRMTVYDFVKASPEHTRQHGETIRKALGG